MKKFKVGDRCVVVSPAWGHCVKVGDVGRISRVRKEVGMFDYLFIIDGDDYEWNMNEKDLQLIEDSKESRSKRIAVALRKVCSSGLSIKSEDIISSIKKEINTDYVFGDTILRKLRQLRQDGILDYTADKHTRIYTFK